MPVSRPVKGALIATALVPVKPLWAMTVGLEISADRGVERIHHVDIARSVDRDTKRAC